MRIVTLLPSATEIVCLLGLRESLVGVSHECDFPAEVNSLPRVTRTLLPAKATSREIDECVRQRLDNRQSLYALDLEKLKDLRPDLIVTQNLCSVCAVSTNDLQQAARQLRGTAFLTLEPRTLADVLFSIEQVAEAAGVAEQRQRQVRLLRQRIEAVQTATAQRSFRPTAVFLEWLDPPFSAGHWVPELVELAGARELIGRAGEHSQTIRWTDVAAADPDLIVAAACGYSVEQTRQDVRRLGELPEWRSLRAVRNERIIFLDGSSYFSRPGPRLVNGLELLAAKIAACGQACL